MKSKKQKYWHTSILFGLTLLLYAKSAGNEFLLRWDDQWVVINTYTEQGLTWQNIWHVLTDFYHGQYAPLNEFMYMMIFEVFGYNSTAFHWASIILHACNVVLVYIFISGLLHGINYNRTYNDNRNRSVRDMAFLTALIFAVHPVCVESVSWLSASKVLIYTFYYLIGLCLYTRYVRKTTRALYLLIILCFILSFGGKEQAVVFFLSCLLIDYTVGREGKCMDILLEKFPMVLLALFFGIITILSQVAHGSSSMPQYDLPARCLLACYSLMEYLIKAFFPFNLSYIYPFPFQPGEPIPASLCIYPLMVGAICYSLYMCRNNRLVIFASLFFAINLLVTLHIIPISRFAVTADRYSYISLIGPSLIATWLYFKYAKGKGAAYLRIIMCLYIGYLVATTFEYQNQWKNSEILKLHIREILNSRSELSYTPMTEQGARADIPMIPDSKR